MAAHYELLAGPNLRLVGLRGFKLLVMVNYPFMRLFVYIKAEAPLWEASHYLYLFLLEF